MNIIDNKTLFHIFLKICRISKKFCDNKRPIFKIKVGLFIELM